jgi:hypothetical protein
MAIVYEMLVKKVSKQEKTSTILYWFKEERREFLKTK